MSTPLALAEEDPFKTAKAKRSPAYAAALWARWPACDRWPGILDLYEAAAYLRVDYKSIWRACQVGRSDKKAALKHQRIGSIYRIARADLDTFGRVEGRVAA